VANSLHTYPMRRIWKIIVAKEEPYKSENLTNYIADLKPFFQKGEIKEKIKKEIVDFTFIDRLTKDAEEFTSVLIIPRISSFVRTVNSSG
jgi:hypothetical protein